MAGDEVALSGEFDDLVDLSGDCDVIEAGVVGEGVGIEAGDEAVAPGEDSAGLIDESVEEVDFGMVGAFGDEGAIVFVDGEVLGGELHNPVVVEDGGSAVFALGDLFE